MVALEDTVCIMVCGKKFITSFSPHRDFQLSVVKPHLSQSEQVHAINQYASNRPVSYSNGWTGFSMKWRLMRAN